ncbi:hypothetical protein QFC21_005192 [Naganishia friedmannii]|uniref:Uncharacterized protein n=1 Tax=Naganishia friedmannii TaxID=89922 RepID=A0ACC2VCM9_9TREE|nr:hypothetical protein QFC21_005192 [Naganishia friedmannii]
MYDIIDTNGNQATERVPHDYFLYNPVLPCDSSSNSFITVSSAAEDGQIFADDDYQYGGSLKVHVPGTSRSILALAREDMPPSDSGLYFAITSSSGPSNTSEHAQTTLSPGNSALPIIGEAEAETQGLERESVIGKSALQTKALSPLQLPEEEPSAKKIDLTPLVEHRDPLQTFAASKIFKGSTDARPYDDNATPRQCAVAANAVKETMLPHANTDTESRIFNHLSMKNESSFVNGRQPESIACDTCQSVDQLFTRTPSINIVGANGNQAKCTFCQKTVSDFMPGQRASAATERASRRAVSVLRKPSPPFNASHNATDRDIKSYTAKPPVIMRIDNIAWDATPEKVEKFLPPNVLADTLQSVHLLIDRHDGKSKDYLFIEVKDLVAARSILQHRQNAVLGTGSRARPVTITLTTEEKLVEELRPDSRSEIMGLLELCNAAIARNIGHDDNNPKEGRFNKETTVYGWQTGGRHPLQTGVFLKSRYAPFWCALSVVSRLSIGHEVFWDMFRAISILAKHLVAIAASYENIGHDLAKPLTDDDADQTLAASFSQQRAPSNNCALPPSSSSERNSNDNIDPNVADLNARIRERLEAETARDMSRTAKRLATRARLLGSSETEQERYQRRLCKSADSNGVHHARQGEWTQSDSQMLEKLVKVFEVKFGVQVELKDKA